MAAAGAPFRRILVAYDGSDQSRDALDRAIDLALSWSCHLSIISVFQPPTPWVAGPMAGPVVAPPEPPEEADRGAMTKVLEVALRRARDRGVVDPHGEVRREHPADGILHMADDDHADLIVLGSRGRSTTTRLLLGSITDAVVHHARVPVLVVRPPAPSKA